MAHRSILIMLIALVMCGCAKQSGPPMGQVKGVVTMDGNPVPKAIIRFAPQGDASMTSGGSSVGITDAQGNYELEYSNTQSGAVVGQHRVTISTHRQADEDEEGNRTPGSQETIPVDYNKDAAKNPDMLREVKSGSNEINFELKSGGELFQPVKEDQG